MELHAALLDSCSQEKKVHNAFVINTKNGISSSTAIIEHKLSSLDLVVTKLKSSTSKILFLLSPRGKPKEKNVITGVKNRCYSNKKSWSLQLSLQIY